MTTMRLYADRTPKLTRQVLGDLLAILTAVIGAQFVSWVHDTVSDLAGPGRKLEGTGDSLSDHLQSAGDRVDNVPAVGDKLRAPLDSAGKAAHGLVDAGQEFQDLVSRLALIAALSAAVVPVLLVLAWILWRIRWMRRAAAAARLLRTGADASLFALRALTRQPLRTLDRLSRALSGGGYPVDLAGAWRVGDYQIIHALANLELAGLGISPQPDRFRTTWRQNW